MRTALGALDLSSKRAFNFWNDCAGVIALDELYKMKSWHVWPSVPKCTNMFAHEACLLSLIMKPIRKHIAASPTYRFTNKQQ